MSVTVNFARYRARKLAGEVERLYPHCRGTFGDFMNAWQQALDHQKGTTDARSR